MAEKKHFVVSIEKDNDGTYIAYNIDDSGFTLLGRGNTVAEAKNDFFNSVHEAVSVCTETGSMVPDILSVVPEFRFDLSSLFEYYSMINVSAFARYVGINDALMRQYKRGETYVSDAQLKKIENAIHRLGNEFSNLSIV